MRFADAMAARTEDELVDIVTDSPDDWEPEAIEAARRELEKRGVRVDEDAPPRPKSKAKRKPSITEANDQGPPLAFQMKVVAFLFGLVLSWLAVLVSGFARRRWREKGRGRQGTELLQVTLAGAVAQLVIFAVRC